MKGKLSMAFQDLRGTDGTVVIRKGRQGLVLTPHVTPRNPRTGAQMAMRGFLGRASKAYENMTDTQLKAWREYAEGITVTDPITGKSYTPSPSNVFVGLATKFLQLSPSGTVPMTPPSSDFTGDSILLSYVAGTGTITVTASGANAAGVTTEILIQPLKSGARVPDANAYVHAAFKAFASGNLSQVLNVSAGHYALAYRFVKTSTGQSTLPIPFGKTVVSFSVEEGGETTVEAAAPKAKKKAA